MTKFATYAVAATVLASTMLTSCASIVDGGNQSVNIRPSTVGGQVNVKVTSKHGTQSAVMPGSISVDHDRSELLITVDDPCYEPTQMSSSSTLNPWAIGNILMSILGLTGTTVDMQSGNAWKYDDVITVPTVKKNACK